MTSSVSSRQFTILALPALFAALLVMGLSSAHDCRFATDCVSDAPNCSSNAGVLTFFVYVGDQPSLALVSTPERVESHSEVVPTAFALPYARETLDVAPTTSPPRGTRRTDEIRQ